MVVQRQKCVVRFGLVHLMATNVAMWVCTAVSEIETDFTVSRHQLFTPPTVASPTTGLFLSHYQLLVFSLATDLSLNPLLAIQPLEAIVGWQCRSGGAVW